MIRAARHLRQTPRPHGGFTIIELLVVIGIIVLLASILTPMIMSSYRNATVARMHMDLQTISTALDAYRNDHGDYPRLPTLTTPVKDLGAKVLVYSLVAPREASIDGADGPGFRLRAQGKVFGPYLASEKFKIGNPSDPNDTDMSTFCFLDDDNKPILYFPAHTKGPVVAAGTYVDNTNLAMYRPDDNLKTTSPLEQWITTEDMRKFLGETNPNGAIEANEQARYTGPFILWMAGLDNVFGTADDITNFTGK